MSIAPFYISVGDGTTYSDASANQVADGQIFDTDGTYQGWLNINGSTIRIQRQRTPASSSDPGLLGEICIDSNYLYYCVSSNTWKRIALSAW